MTMKPFAVCLISVLLAGCTSARVAQSQAGGPTHSVLAENTPAPIPYHYELMPEYAEGTSEFLRLVPVVMP